MKKPLLIVLLLATVSGFAAENDVALMKKDASDGWVEIILPDKGADAVLSFDDSGSSVQWWNASELAAALSLVSASSANIFTANNTFNTTGGDTFFTIGDSTDTALQIVSSNSADRVFITEVTSGSTMISYDHSTDTHVIGGNAININGSTNNITTNGPIVSNQVFSNTGTTLTIGAGNAGIDYGIAFNGEDNDGRIDWMEDENLFQVNDAVSLDGSSDTIQLQIQGNATQTSNLIVLEQSDGTDVFTVNNDGDTQLNGDLTLSNAPATLSATGNNQPPIKTAVEDYVSNSRELIFSGHQLRAFTQSTGGLLASSAGSGSGSPIAGFLVIQAEGGSNKLEIPIPTDWSDNVRVTSYWTNRTITGSSGVVRIWATPIYSNPTGGGSTATNLSIGTRVEESLSFSYSVTGEIYISQVDLDFSTATAGPLRFIELYRRDVATEDTSTLDTYLSIVKIEEL